MYLLRSLLYILDTYFSKVIFLSDRYFITQNPNPIRYQVSLYLVHDKAKYILDNAFLRQANNLNGSQDTTLKSVALKTEWRSKFRKPTDPYLFLDIRW